MKPPKPKRTAQEYALWAALPMATTSKVEGRLKTILDKSRCRRRLTRGVIAAALTLTVGMAVALGTAQTEPPTLVAAITSGEYPADSPAHIAVNIAFLKMQIRRFGDTDPWAGKAYYVLGSEQVSARQYDDALASFDKATLLPEPPYVNSGIHSSARYERINTLDTAGRYPEAIRETQILLRNKGRGVLAPDQWENLRERLPEFQMMQGYADKRAEVKGFYAAFPSAADSRWTQSLPNGVTVQFAGCQQQRTNIQQPVGLQHSAWSPDGRFLARASFERNDGDPAPMTYSGFTANYVAKEQAKRAQEVGFAVRLAYPRGTVVKVAFAVAGNGDMETNEIGLTTSNGVVLSDEQELTRATGGVRLGAAHFPSTQRQAALRVGIAVGTVKSPPPDTPNAAYQWAEFPNITLPPLEQQIEGRTQMTLDNTQNRRRTPQRVWLTALGLTAGVLASIAMPRPAAGAEPTAPVTQGRGVAGATARLKQIYQVLTMYRIQHYGALPETNSAELLRELTHRPTVYGLPERGAGNASQAIQLLNNPDNSLCLYYLHNKRPDGTLVGSPKRPGTRDVWATTDQFVQNHPHGAAGFYLVLWEDGSVGQIPASKILAVQAYDVIGPPGATAESAQRGEKQIAYPGQAGLP